MYKVSTWKLVVNCKQETVVHMKRALLANGKDDF